MMKFDDKKYLAKLIKEYRKKAGLTQAQLAEKVDLSVQHISRIESACYIPSLKSFFQIITVLKIDLSLFGFGAKLTGNKTKDDLVEIIQKASDEDLIFLENIIKATKKSLLDFKKARFEIRFLDN